MAATLTEGRFDILEVQRQLTASEAYNRFMDRRVAQLERELDVFKQARVEVRSIAGAGAGAVDSKPAIQALVHDNTRIRVELHQAAAERDRVATEASSLATALRHAETEVTGLKSHVAALERELVELRDLLPPAVKEHVQRRRQASTRQQQRSADNPDAADTESVLSSDHASRKGAGTPRPDDDDNDDAPPPPPVESETQHEPPAVDFKGGLEVEPLFNAGEDIKARANLINLRTASLADLAQRAVDPPPAGHCAQLCERTRQYVVDLRDIVEKLPGLAAQLQLARRSALSVIVECQATTTPSKSIRVRVQATDRDVSAKRTAIHDKVADVAARLPLAAGGLVGCATIVAGLAVRFPAASGMATVKLLELVARTVQRFAFFDVNYAKPLSSAAKPVSVDGAVAEIAGACRDAESGRGDDFPRYSIEDLKRMSNECRETSCSVPTFTAAVDMLNSVVSVVADLKRVCSVPRAQAIIPEAHEVDSGSGPHRGPITRGTQVNFYLHSALPTATDQRIAQLAAIKQPWFECLQHVKPLSPRLRARDRSRSRSPSVGVGEHTSGGGIDTDTQAADGQPQAPQEQQQQQQEHQHRSLRDVEAVIAEYRARGLPLPSNFARVRGDVYQFGDKRVLLRAVRGTLTAKVGGGYVSFEEFVGMHYASEERHLRSPARAHRVISVPGRFGPVVVGGEELPPPRPRLPDSPLVRNRRPRSKTPGRHGGPAAEVPQQMDAELREKLRAMGFTDDDFTAPSLTPE
jgi:hypothetical protein